MRKIFRRLVACGAAVTAGIMLGGPPAAADAATPFTFTHAATYESTAVPTGSLLALFTGRISNEAFHQYEPWTRVADDGLRVEMACSDSVPWRDLPILFVGHSGAGTQINVYVPNAVPPEPWGSCANAGQRQVRIYPHGDASRVLVGTVSMIALHPGLFAVGASPAGSHVAGGVTADLWDCGRTANCPVRVGGQPATLFVDATGTDYARCDPCPGDQVKVVLNRVATGAEFTLPAQSIVQVEPNRPGRERLRVTVPATLAEGEYRVRVWNHRTGFAAQDLRVTFAPPA